MVHFHNRRIAEFVLFYACVTHSGRITANPEVSPQETLLIDLS